MRMTIMTVSLLANISCGGDGSTGRAPGPSNPQGFADPPGNAQSAGQTTWAGTDEVPIDTGQEGDLGDEAYTWTEDVDEDGELEECALVEDDESGFAIVACEPFDDECEDGTPVTATLIVIVEADGSGAFALADEDICGTGADLIGCDFDAQGEIGDCGACVLSGEDLECEE